MVCGFKRRRFRLFLVDMVGAVEQQARTGDADEVMIAEHPALGAPNPVCIPCGFWHRGIDGPWGKYGV